VTFFPLATKSYGSLGTAIGRFRAFRGSTVDFMMGRVRNSALANSTLRVGGRRAQGLRIGVVELERNPYSQSERKIVDNTQIRK
jgi:hypothetical protein